MAESSSVSLTCLLILRLAMKDVAATAPVSSSLSRGRFARP
jgi:hypothetical protein